MTLDEGKTRQSTHQADLKLLAAKRAMELVQPGMTLGLGSGIRNRPLHHNSHSR